MPLNDKQKGLLGKFIRLDESGKLNPRKPGELDLTRPSVLIGLTLAYIVVVFMVIFGVPINGIHSDPIPVEDLPVAIPLFILAYVVVIGGFYLRDRRRKRQ